MILDVRKYNVIEDKDGYSLIGHKEDLINLYRAFLKEQFNYFEIDDILEIAQLLKRLYEVEDNYLMYVYYPGESYDFDILSKEI